MASLDKILKGLMSDITIDPFNKEYSFKKIVHFLEEVMDNKDNIDLNNVTTALSTLYINMFYQSILNNTQQTISNFKLSYEEIRKFAISCSNRDRVVSSHTLAQYLLDKENGDKKISFEDLFAIRLGRDKDNIEIKSISNQSIEVTNHTLKILSKCKFDMYTVSFDEEKFSIYHKILFNGNMQYILKDFYEAAVWENGYINYEDGRKALFLKFKNESLQYVKRIGELRLQKAVASQVVFLSQDTMQRRGLHNAYRLSVNNKSLNIVKIENGEMEICINDQYEEGGFKQYLIFIATLSTFYPFLQNINVKLPKLSDLTLNDIQILYSEVANIVYKANEVMVNDYNNVEEFERNLDKYALRIKENSLEKALIELTGFTSKQVKYFITTFVFNKEFNDLWRTPFVRQNNYYILPIEPLVSQNKIYLTDYILQLGGVSMGDRGIMLERYLKQEIETALKDKGFYGRIPQQKKFKSVNNSFEEIDLILNTKKSVLVIEIKCISSSVDSRSSYNALKQLKKGAEQIKRKTQFIIDYAEEFKNQIGDTRDKAIFGLVVTNLPNFTGLVLDGVPIVDRLAINNYFNLGGIINSDDRNFFSYYNSETEFSQNMPAYFSSPYLIWSLKKHFYSYTKKMTPDGIYPELYADIIESSGDII